MIGTNQSAITAWELGQRTPSEKLMKKAFDMIQIAVGIT